MTVAADPVLQALLEAAVEGTGGGEGWLLARRADLLEVVAAHGSLAGSVLGMTVPADAGTAGFVVGSGQPIALALRPDDPRGEAGMALVMGRRPATVLCVPCESDDGVAGALEVVDKAGGTNFTFNDVELATLLAGVAGVAIHANATSSMRVPDPAALAGELQRLAETDPTRYAAVADVLAALIASG